jgi:rfaE bifunctional protein nucleotidyltransferase chain/domain
MITTLRDLPRIRAVHKDQIVILALGAFDIVHFGHLKYLEWAKQQGDILVVTLKSDEQISRHKGASRPVIVEQERAEIIDALKPVDYALIGAEGDLHGAAIATARALQPDVIVLGPDWGDSVIDSWRADFPQAKIVVSPPRVGPSTTAIILKIKAQP